MSSIKKASYYVHYLGWKKSCGLCGVQFTTPVVEELLQRSRTEAVQLPKLNIVITQKEIRISQEEIANSRCSAIKHPPILASNVAFANVGFRSEDSDIVSIIFVGYNPANQFFANVHVYRCDSPQTANQFNSHLNQIIGTPKHRKRLEMIEKEQASKGFFLPSNQLSNTSPTAYALAKMYDSQKDLVATTIDSVTDELNERFKRKDATLLLPPRDYDTISRNQGSTDLKQRLIAMQEDSVRNESKPQAIYRKQMPNYNSPEPDYDVNERGILREHYNYKEISTRETPFLSVNPDDFNHRHTFTEPCVHYDDILNSSTNSSRNSSDYGKRKQSGTKIEPGVHQDDILNLSTNSSRNGSDYVKRISQPGTKIEMPSSSQTNKSGFQSSSKGTVIY